MFIQTEETPNPQTLKFIPGEPVLSDRTAFFTNEESAKASPLAMALFAAGGINAVFFGRDFITITKSEDTDWSHIKPSLLSTIMEHYVQNKPIMADSHGKEAVSLKEIEYSPAELEIVEQIKELLEHRVRPAVAQDGGDIIFHAYKDGVVHLEMHGACSGCPSSSVTLKHGIENMLRHYIPEIIAVEPVVA